MEVKTNWNKTDEVFSRLLHAHKHNKYPYNQSRLPQRSENLPSKLKLGSRLHALYLFFACNYMRGPINSNFAFGQLAEAWKVDNDIFDPRVLIANTGLEGARERVHGVLLEAELHYNAEAVSQYWVFNACKLYWHWNADPKMIFTELSDYSAIKKCLIGDTEQKNSLVTSEGFKGFGEKMASMLAYFYIEAGIISESRIPAPIDFHLLRIMTACRLLTVPDERADRFTENYVQAAQRLTVQYCEKNDVSVVSLSEALWILSRELCRLNPGNRMHQGENRGRNTDLESVEINWNRKQRDRFKQSCMRCPVRSHCELNVPSAIYYRWGKLIATGKRKEPPEKLVNISNYQKSRQGSLFSL